MDGDYYVPIEGSLFPSYGDPASPSSSWLHGGEMVRAGPCLVSALSGAVVGFGIDPLTCKQCRKEGARVGHETRDLSILEWQWKEITVFSDVCVKHSNHPHGMVVECWTRYLASRKTIIIIKTRKQIVWTII